LERTWTWTREKRGEGRGKGTLKISRVGIDHTYLGMKKKRIRNVSHGQENWEREERE